jgi:hypothetical protein
MIHTSAHLYVGTTVSHKTVTNNQDTMFSQQCCWRFKSSVMWRCVRGSKYCNAFSFSVKQWFLECSTVKLKTLWSLRPPSTTPPTQHHTQLDLSLQNKYLIQKTLNSFIKPKWWRANRSLQFCALQTLWHQANGSLTAFTVFTPSILVAILRQLLLKNKEPIFRFTLKTDDITTFIMYVWPLILYGSHMIYDTVYLGTDSHKHVAYFRRDTHATIHHTTWSHINKTVIIRFTAVGTSGLA